MRVFTYILKTYSFGGYHLWHILNNVLFCHVIDIMSRENFVSEAAIRQPVAVQVRNFPVSELQEPIDVHALTSDALVLQVLHSPAPIHEVLGHLTAANTAQATLEVLCVEGRRPGQRKRL